MSSKRLENYYEILDLSSFHEERRVNLIPRTENIFLKGEKFEDEIIA